MKFANEFNSSLELLKNCFQLDIIAVVTDKWKLKKKKKKNNKENKWKNRL